MFRSGGLACALATAFASVALGQAVVQETQTTVAPGVPAPQIRRVTHLIGSRVALQGMNNYGRVEDVVLNDNGGIGYLVVANGGRYAMLPWSAANVNFGQRIVTYNVTPQAIQPLFFPTTAWPNIADQQFTTRMQQVFPGTGVVRREVLRPVEGTIPAGPAVDQQKVKVKPNGTVKVKEKIK